MLKIFPQEAKAKNSYPQLWPPWGFVDIVAILIFIFLFSVFFSVFGLDLANWVLSCFPGIGSIEVAVAVTGGFLQGILMVIFVLAAASMRKAPLTALGFDNFDWRSLFVYGIVGGMGVFLLVTFMMAIIISLFPQPPQPQPIAEIILNARGWGQILPLLLLVSVIAPLSEELFFRGFIYPVLRSRFGVAWGITATACFFSLIHFDLIRFIPLALGGACLTFFCEKSKSLYPAIAAHSMWNTVMTLFIIYYNIAL